MEWVLETENVIQRSKQCSRRVIIENVDRYLAQTARHNHIVSASLMEVPDLQLKLFDIDSITLVCILREAGIKGHHLGKRLIDQRYLFTNESHFSVFEN